jgi:hypothetical protein
MSLKPSLSAFRILLSFTLVLSFASAASALNGSPIFVQPPTYASGGESAISVAVGDLNGDGIPDMVVANDCVDSSCSTGSVSVLLGNGDGTFQPAQSYPSGGLYSFSVAVGDFNGDGKSDVVVANECQTSACSGGSVSVLLGNGDGTLQPARSYASGGLYALSVAVAAFNGDGKSDVVVANECQTSACTSGSMSVLLGNGDGTLQLAQSYTSGSVTLSVAVGDFNGDGKPDVVVANECQPSSCSGGNVTVLLGNGDGTFQPALSYASGGLYAFSVAVGDLNGDGKLDLVVGNQCQTSACSSGGIGVLLGNGDGTFQPAQSYASGAMYSNSVAVGDLNGDGKLDVVAGDRNSGYVSVLLGNGDGTVQAAQLYSSWNLYSVAVSDVNGDGKADVLAVNLCQPGNCTNGSVSVMLGNADGSLQADRAFTPSGLGPDYIAVGDLNGDGKLDMVVADYCTSSSNCNNNVVSVMLGNGDGTFQAGQTYSVGGAANSSSVNIADLNGDGKPDLLVTNKCSDSGCTNGSISVLLGNGDGTFQAAQSYSSGGRYALIAAVADFNGDGKLDVAVSNDDDQTVGVLLGNGDGTFQPARTYSSGAGLPQAIAVGDFNGDGKADIVVMNYGVVGILLGNGDGTFQPVVTYSFGSGYGNSVAVADFNGDGKTDLVVSNTNGIGVLLGNGDGTFQPVQTYAPGWNLAYGGANSVMVGDFNGDGKADVIAAGQTATSILLGNGDGTFQTGIPYNPGGMLTAAGDLNGDRKPDVIVLQGGTAVVLLNIYPFPTATSLSSLPNPSSFGQLVTFTATVTSGAGALTGAVTFNDGNNSLGTGTLTNGTTSLTTSTLAVGGHSITAVYSGNNVGSTSAALTQTVQQAVTSTALASSANPSMSGSSVTFTATVTNGGSATPTGTVTFMDGATTLGTGALNVGVATYTTSGLAVGQHSMTAGYGGDADNAGSTSVAMTQSVNAADFTLASNPKTATVAAGQPGTFTLTVTPQGSFTSPITFSCSGLPAHAGCTFSPATLTPNTGTVTTTLTIATAVQAASLAAPPIGRRSNPLYSIWLVLPAMLVGMAAPKRRKLLSCCLALLLVGGCLLQAACGGGSGGGFTAVGTYPVTVHGVAGSTQHAMNVTLIVQ